MNAPDSTPQTTSRREARRLERRDAILTLAARSFLDHGYAATTMSAIAAEMGGSKGTLWSYFPSKEALFGAVIERETAAYRENLSRVLDPSDDLLPTLHRFCATLIAKITSPEAIALLRLITAEVQRYPELGAIFYDHAPRSTKILLTAYLAGAMDRGLLRRDDPEMAANALMTLAKAGCHSQILWGMQDGITPERIEADCNFAIDLFMRAYSP
jgi:TetR/AcrR family transcriptional repressor of mexJK operon